MLLLVISNLFTCSTTCNIRNICNICIFPMYQVIKLKTVLCSSKGFFFFFINKYNAKYHKDLRLSKQKNKTKNKNKTIKSSCND